MTDYYKFYKTRSKKAVDRIKKLEADTTDLANEIIDLRRKLRDAVTERNKLRYSYDKMEDVNSGIVAKNCRLMIENGGLSDQMESTEKKLYDQQCDNIRLSGAVGALEWVAAAAIRGDK